VTRSICIIVSKWYGVRPGVVHILFSCDSGCGYVVVVGEVCKIVDQKLGSIFGKGKYAVGMDWRSGVRI
jgi:hypothetical protein